MTDQSGSSPRSPLAAGALFGAYAWTTFAIVEVVLARALPATALVVPPPVQISVRTAWLYPAIGALLGAVIGALTFRAAPPRVARVRLHAATLLSVLGAYAISTAAALFSRGVRLSLWIAAALAAGLVAEWIVAPRRRLAGVRALSGWSVAGLVGVPCWMRFGGPLMPFAKKLTAASIGVAVVVLIAAIVAARRRRRHPSDDARVPWRGLAAALCVLPIAASVTLPSASSPPAGPTPPDIVLIVLDTVRADHLSSYGYARETTPNLAAFASRATQFDAAIAASDMTLSSTASILTGVYPFQHGAYTRRGRLVGSAMLRTVPTAAELLAPRGYHAIAAVANSGFLHPVYGFARGFDRYDWDLFDRATLLGRLAQLAAHGRHAPAYADAQLLTDHVIESLDAAARARAPLFVFVNYMDAHWPLRPSADRLAAFGRGLTPDEFQRVDGDILAGRARLPDALRAPLINEYDASLAHLDAQVGRLLAQLAASDRYDDSLIIVTSDHGELLGENGRVGHGLGVMDTLTHVPLMVKFPQQREGRRVGLPVSHVDLLPTILESAGLVADPESAGRGLAHLQDARDTPIVSLSFPMDATGVQMAVYLGETKLVLDPSGQRTLVDLATGAARAVAAEDVPAADRMLRQALMMTPPPDLGGGSDAFEKLRSLGYVR